MEKIEARAKYLKESVPIDRQSAKKKRRLSDSWSGRGKKMNTEEIILAKKNTSE